MTGRHLAERDRNLDRSLRLVSDGFICIFAAWTVCAHVVVWSGASFATLRLLSPLALAAGIILFLCTRRKSTTAPSYVPAGDNPSRESRLWFLWLAAAMGGAAWALLPLWVAWGWSIVCLAAAFVSAPHTDTLAPAATGTTKRDMLVLSLAAVVAVAAPLFTHRPDADDCLYLNMAASVLDAPHAPIFASDTLHGIPGGTYLPTYRFHTIELFVALIAGWLGAQPIVVAHLLLPPLFALVAVCGWARLARFLVGRAWSVCTATTVALLLLARGSHWIYGNFAFVRMFQGKGVFVTALVPTIVALTLEQLHDSRGRGWCLLAASQIAAVGLTANAIYIAPLAVGLAATAGIQRRPDALRRWSSILTSSFYPIAAALLLSFQLMKLGIHMDQAAPLLRLPTILAVFFGSAMSRALWLGGLLAAPAAFTGSRRRWTAGLGLLFVAPFLCPWLDGFWARHLTGPHLLWRLFWAIPLPFLFAAVPVALWQGARARSGVGRGFLLVAGLSPLAVFGYESFVVARLELSWPALKVPRAEYGVAKEVVATQPPGSEVLACADVAVWIPTFRGYPRLVASRETYLVPVLGLFPEWAEGARLKERLRLLRYVSGTMDQPGEEQLLASWLEKREIATVVIPASAPNWISLDRVLRAHSFAATARNGYWIYRFVP